MPVHKKPRDFTNTPTRIVIFLFVALALIALMGIALSNSPSSKTGPSPRLSETINLSPHTLIYGSWATGSSVIVAYDLSTGREGIIARLPENIKKVSVLSPNSLLFINKTDLSDHGREIVQYNLTSQEATVTYRTSDSYGIDNYVLSPDSKRLAVWEVQVNKDSKTLRNGKSRVYTAFVGEIGKNLIYDEQATEENPVRYPIAILNNGTIFMDRFLPNSGAGFAYGISMSNFIGTQKEDIAAMQNGTYGTKPLLSPDGTHLIFTGYNGAKGNGQTIVNGFRRSLVSANTVELLDTQTLQRTKLENLPTTNLYSAVNWHTDSTNVFIASNNRDTAQTGTFLYNQTARALTSLPSPQTIEGQFVQQLSANAWLFGDKNASLSIVGNLGRTYDAPYTVFSIYNPQTKKTTPLRTQSDLVQLIAVLPATSFGSFQVLLEKTPPSDENLLLQTFNVKINLAPIREKQQSTPIDTQSLSENNSATCPEYTAVQISQACGNPPMARTTNALTQAAFLKCSKNIIDTNNLNELCY